MVPARWFGARWAAPICGEAPAIAAPVGEICPLCAEAIEPDSRGVVLPYSRAGESNRRRAIHFGCLFSLADILPADEMDRLLPDEEG